MITLRHCDEDDLKELKRIYEIVYSEDRMFPGFSSIDDFKKTLKTERVYLERSLLAYDDDGDGSIVGFILVSVRHKNAHVLAFGVAKEHRRKGVGKRLLNRLIRDLVEIEEIVNIYIEVKEDAEHALKLLDEYKFEKNRLLHSMYRVCGEKEVLPSQYNITTEFPSALLKNYQSFHPIEQSWNRSNESLQTYDSRVIGYSVSQKGRVLGYVLVAFDQTILDLCSRTLVNNDFKHIIALLQYLFVKFDNLVTIDVPEDDEIFKIYQQTGFQIAYSKHELVLVIKHAD